MCSLAEPTTTTYQHITVPVGGHKISVNTDGSINVPDDPVIPFIEGGGTALDITPVMIRVVNAAVSKAYGGKKKTGCALSEFVVTSAHDAARRVIAEHESIPLSRDGQLAFV